MKVSELIEALQDPLLDPDAETGIERVSTPYTEKGRRKLLVETSGNGILWVRLDGAPAHVE